MRASFELEAVELQIHGGPVAGVDEAGRGPLAGPVVAAAVILDPHNIPDGIADSKTLEPHVRRALELVFNEFGLPDAMRSDNGPPFASTGLAGLSQLSVWWMKLGIRHERIEPGKPEQNGRHERMHRTLKQETASPPCASLKAQQRAFDRFRKEYNEDRPHDALGGHVPADYYEPSSRRLPDPPWGKPFTYPEQNRREGRTEEEPHIPAAEPHDNE